MKLEAAEVWYDLAEVKVEKEEGGDGFRIIVEGS